MRGVSVPSFEMFSPTCLLEQGDEAAEGRLGQERDYEGLGMRQEPVIVTNDIG